MFSRLSSPTQTVVEDFLKRSDFTLCVRWENVKFALSNEE